MPLLHLSLPPHRLLVGRCRLFAPPTHAPSRLSVRASAAASTVYEVSVLPFPPERASHHRELAAAVASVERACRLCLDVKASLLSGDRKILEKYDETPVTIADFELQQLFPSIPLVAEEDSACLRSYYSDATNSNVVVETIASFVADNVNNTDSPLTHDDVLGAIDRGGKDAVSFDSNTATYWVLDLIDGTKSFLKGGDGLYVDVQNCTSIHVCYGLHISASEKKNVIPIEQAWGSWLLLATPCSICDSDACIKRDNQHYQVGLALVVDGKLAVGVIGCPNLTDDTIGTKKDEGLAACPGQGILMVSHVGCGTWSRPLSAEIGQFATALDVWRRCYVDPCSVAHMARFCIVDSHTWDMMPVSVHFSSTMDESEPRDENKILLENSCGGSLSKYLMVASGRMSVFILLARVEKLLKAWDHAVGVICVEEAGGQTCDWSGKPLDFSADLTGRRIIYPSGGVLSTNGALHDKLVEMILANNK